MYNKLSSVVAVVAISFLCLIICSFYVNDMRDKNVLGTELQLCCSDPVTGFYRNGMCVTGPTDFGTHIVCAMVTQQFLDFSKAKGNDLTTPREEYNFPGLKHGDKWCLCISRWIEAYEAGVAPPIDLEATNENALDYITLDILKVYDIKIQN